MHLSSPPFLQPGTAFAPRRVPTEGGGSFFRGGGGFLVLRPLAVSGPNSTEHLLKFHPVRDAPILHSYHSTLLLHSLIILHTTIFCYSLLRTFVTTLYHHTPALCSAAICIFHGCACLFIFAISPRYYILYHERYIVYSIHLVPR